MRKYEEFSKLFKQLNGQDQQELITIMEGIASHSTKPQTEVYKTYLENCMKNFSLVSGQKEEDFGQFKNNPAMVQAKALSYFSMMGEKYQDIVLSGLKGMV